MKLQAFSRQVDVFLADLKSPKARSERLAKVAAEGIADIRKKNKAAAGVDPEPTIYVDGAKGAALASVKPDGRIVADFNPVLSAVEWIAEQVVLASPVLTGRYARSHMLFVDGVEHDTSTPMADGEEYIFLNVQPYARKIERGQSDQAPDGVFQAIAAVARKRFSNMAIVRFSYRSLQEGGIVAYRGVDDRAPTSRNRRGRFAKGSGAGIMSDSDRAARKRERDTRVPAIIVRSY